MGKLPEAWVKSAMENDVVTIRGIPDTELNEAELRAALRGLMKAKRASDASHEKSMDLMRSLDAADKLRKQTASPVDELYRYFGMK